MYHLHLEALDCKIFWRVVVMVYSQNVCQKRESKKVFGISAHVIQSLGTWLEKINPCVHETRQLRIPKHMKIENCARDLELLVQVGKWLLNWMATVRNPVRTNIQRPAAIQMHMFVLSVSICLSNSCIIKSQYKLRKSLDKLLNFKM